MTLIPRENHTIRSKSVYGIFINLLLVMQFLLHVQELRQAWYRFPQVQVLHVDLIPLHLHVAVTSDSFTSELEPEGFVYHFIEIQFWPVCNCHPHSNFEGAGHWESVLPHIHPAWKALLKMCSSKAFFDGGSSLRSKLVDTEYIANRVISKSNPCFRYMWVTNCSTIPLQDCTTSIVGSQLSCWNAVVNSFHLEYFIHDSKKVFFVFFIKCRSWITACHRVKEGQS